MTHDVFGYRNGKPFAVLSRKFGMPPTYTPLPASAYAAAPEEPATAGSSGAMVWRTTEQLRTALEFLSADPGQAGQHRFINDLLQASLEDGGVWVRFN